MQSQHPHNRTITSHSSLRTQKRTKNLQLIHNPANYVPTVALDPQENRDTEQETMERMALRYAIMEASLIGSKYDMLFAATQYYMEGSQEEREGKMKEIVKRYMHEKAGIDIERGHFRERIDSGCIPHSQHVYQLKYLMYGVDLLNSKRLTQYFKGRAHFTWVDPSHIVLVFTQLSVAHDFLERNVLNRRKQMLVTWQNNPSVIARDWIQLSPYGQLLFKRRLFIRNLTLQDQETIQKIRNKAQNQQQGPQQYQKYFQAKQSLIQFLKQNPKVKEAVQQYDQHRATSTDPTQRHKKQKQKIQNKQRMHVERMRSQKERGQMQDEARSRSRDRRGSRHFNDSQWNGQKGYGDRPNHMNRRGMINDSYNRGEDRRARTQPKYAEQGNNNPPSRRNYNNQPQQRNYNNQPQQRNYNNQPQQRNYNNNPFQQRNQDIRSQNSKNSNNIIDSQLLNEFNRIDIRNQSANNIIPPFQTIQIQNNIPVQPVVSSKAKQDPFSRPFLPDLQSQQLSSNHSELNKMVNMINGMQLSSSLSNDYSAINNNSRHIISHMNNTIGDSQQVSHLTSSLHTDSHISNSLQGESHLSSIIEVDDGAVEATGGNAKREFGDSLQFSYGSQYESEASMQHSFGTKLEQEHKKAGGVNKPVKKTQAWNNIDY